VDDQAADGTTALVIAAFAGRRDVATFLLEQGADPSADRGGYSALHAAVLRDDVALTKALLSHGANVNARLAKATFTRTLTARDYAFDKQWIGATPFWLAAAFHDMELVKILATAGADPQLPRGDGNTPLMAAIGTKKVIDYRREFRNGGGLGIHAEALPSAEEQRATPEVIKFIVGLGVDVNATNNDGDSALHRASAKRNLSAVKFLAEHGARLDIKNNEGQTPLAVALAEHPYPKHITSDSELNQKLWTDTFDAPREELAALLRELGATD
jgi:ankyrin repeat protein